MVKFKELSKLSKSEIEAKLRELKLDLIKANLSIAKGGKVKIRELKKTIARLKMLRSRDNK
ncbi:MAG: 50S ribosomal protein L29 [Candidatus Pacearchaeota archaeon]